MNLLVSLQTLAWKKDVEIIAQMHRLRDDMRDTTKGGHILCNEVPEKFGAASQPEIDGMAGLIAGFGKCFETATQLHAAVDTDVIAPLLRLYAKVSGIFVHFDPANALSLTVAIGHRVSTLHSAIASSGYFRRRKSSTTSTTWRKTRASQSCCPP